MKLITELVNLQLMWIVHACVASPPAFALVAPEEETSANVDRFIWFGCLTSLVLVIQFLK